MTTGTVIACCARQERGMPKYPRDEIDVGTFGVDGDYHAGPICKHGSKAGKPNDQAGEHRVQRGLRSPYVLT